VFQFKKAQNKIMESLMEKEPDLDLGRQLESRIKFKLLRVLKNHFLLLFHQVPLVPLTVT